MTGDLLLVNGAGALAIVGILWYFRPASHPRSGTNRQDRTQSALVVVRGGYTPDTVVVDRGRPVKLVFRREESSPCSERIVIPALGRSASLPQGEEVTIEFLPREPGEYAFRCAMGTWRGRIVVE